MKRPEEDKVEIYWEIGTVILDAVRTALDDAVIFYPKKMEFIHRCLTLRWSHYATETHHFERSSKRGTSVSSGTGCLHDPHAFNGSSLNHELPTDGCCT